ncbi:transmembrane protein 254 isoform X12 [Macaca fascicularis]|uniref:transmembrane protein 254 isoform X12 n=1 Tax=Macaca fascicularis TaxID=9541 RepID=UPI003D15AF8E
MAPAAGAAAYFQRGSLFWFTVITLSFGYYTCSCLWVLTSARLLTDFPSLSLSRSGNGLSSGLRVSLIRALGPWAPSLSTWWTTITPSCTMVIGLPG